MMTYGVTSWRPWVLTEEQGRPIIRRAFESGINFVDTADMYSLGVSEEITGRAIKDFAKRDDMVIATKVFNPMGPGPNDRGLSRKHVLSSIDGSLRRLGTDYIDLYQIHRWDPSTPIEETLTALDDIVRAGKARYIGASSMAAWQFAKALYLSDRHGWARFVSMQNHYNLVYREEEREMLPLCAAEGIGVIPWSPARARVSCRQPVSLRLFAGRRHGPLGRRQDRARPLLLCVGLPDGRASRCGRARARHQAGAGGARVAVSQANRGAHHRCVEARAPRRCPGGARNQPVG